MSDTRVSYFSHVIVRAISTATKIIADDHQTIAYKNEEQRHRQQQQQQQQRPNTLWVWLSQ